MVANLFAKVRAAQASMGGNYMKPGFDGTVEIKAIIQKETRKNVDAFIVEFKIAEMHVEHAVHKVGETCSFFTGSDKDAYASNIKNFMLAMFDMKEDEYNEACDNGELEGMFNALVDPEEQAAAGELVGLETYNKIKKDGGDFCMYKFYSLDEEED